jgi:hypothetical protein
MGLTLWVLLRASPVWGLPASGPHWDRSRRCAALGADRLLTALGAAGPEAHSQSEHRGIRDHVIAMDSYAFAQPSNAWASR